jgi:hypothetical protein
MDADSLSVRGRRYLSPNPPPFQDHPDQPQAPPHQPRARSGLGQALLRVSDKQRYEGHSGRDTPGVVQDCGGRRTLSACLRAEAECILAAESGLGAAVFTPGRSR